MALTENHFRISVNLALVLTGKIQVNIRLFIAIKAQKCFKRNIMPILMELSPTYRAKFIRHIAAGTASISPHFFRSKIRIKTFCAVIMRCQRVDLGDAGHSRYKGRTHRTAGADQITVFIGFPDQLLGNDIHDSKTVGNNGVQLMLQPFADLWGQIWTIHAVRLVITDLP